MVNNVSNSVGIDSDAVPIELKKDVRELIVSKAKRSNSFDENAYVIKWVGGIATVGAFFGANNFFGGVALVVTLLAFYRDSENDAVLRREFEIEDYWRKRGWMILQGSNEREIQIVRSVS